jgi:hypothetical protein
MRVAVCFSGQLRFVNEYSKYILENIISKYDVDVYAHLWYDEDMLGKPFHHEFKDGYKEKIEDFVNTYHPKNMKVESKYTHFDKTKYNLVSLEYELRHLSKDLFENMIFRMESQWYSIQQSYQLIENPDQYDFIIRLRTDCYIQQPIKLEDLDKNKLYIQNGFCAGRDRKFCDWFAIGNNVAMKDYMNLYDSCSVYYINGVIHMHRFMEFAFPDSNKVTEYEFHIPIHHGFFKETK